MSKPEKTLKTKARLPRGLIDRGPAEIVATHRMLETIKSLYELYGFEAVETPFFEYTDALGKFLPDQDRPNEGVFSLQDDDEQWMSLRYDLTAPLARYVAENFDRLPKPYRSYRAGYVFRNEKPGPGRFRQFMQFDADTVGASGVAADAEICMMAADTLEALGIERGQYVIKVNNRKILDGVMEAIGLGGEENAGRRLTVLRALDKYDRLGIDGVKLLLGEGRKDESGDFTRGAGLTDEQADRIILLTGQVGFRQSDPELVEASRRRGEPAPPGDWAGEETWPSDEMTLSFARDAVSGSEKGLEGVEELAQIARLLRSADYGPGRISLEPSVVRGLEYYTGPVFEAELTFEIAGDDGKPVRFGSVGGGGRYDGLIGRFRSEPVPATGFSIGVSRLMAALQMVKSPIVTSAERPGPVVVLVMDKDRLADYQAMVAQLRAAGIVAEMYLGDSGMKAQMKYADKRSSPCVIIQGSNEREAGIVQIKDLIEGEKAAQAIKTNAEWKAQRPAQEEVPVERMVEKVLEIIAHHYPDEMERIAARRAAQPSPGR